MNENNENDEYENVYIVFDIPEFLNKKNLNFNSYSIIGLETNTPIVKIDNIVFEGKFENQLIETSLLIPNKLNNNSSSSTDNNNNNNNENENDNENDENSHESIIKTQKVLKLKRVLIGPKYNELEEEEEEEEEFNNNNSDENDSDENNNDND
jgi:hypothetical protein